MGCGDNGGAIHSQISNLISQASSAINQANAALTQYVPVEIGLANQSQSYKRSTGIDTTLEGLSEMRSIADVNISDIIKFNPINDNSKPIILDKIKPVTPGIKPTFNQTMPTATFEDPPTTKPGDAPDEPTIDTDIDIPDPPSYSSLDFPVMDNLLPLDPITLQEINIPTITASAPTPGDIAPKDTFNYIEKDYSSNIAQQLDARMNELAINDVGIPDVIWDAIWEQSRERETKAVNQIIDEINVDFAARGFFMPAGIQAARIDKAKQESLEKTITLSRETAIKRADQEIKTLEFHVQQGIAYEELKIKIFDSQAQRTLESAKYVSQAQIEIANVRIQIHNLVLEAFKAEIQKNEQNIKAELAKLEQDKAHIEMLKISSEVNKAIIEQYKAELSAVEAKINIYKASVEGALGKIQLSQAKAEVYKAQVQGFSAKIEAIKSEYDMHKTKIESKKLEFDAYGSAAQVYATEIQAYKTGIDAQISENQAITQNNEALVKEFEANVKLFASKVQNETASIQGQAQAYTAAMAGAKAKADFYVGMNNAKANMNQSISKDAEAKANIDVANAKMYAEVAEANAEIANSYNQSISQIYSGLAGSIMSSVSIGTGYNISESCADC